MSSASSANGRAPIHPRLSCAEVGGGAGPRPGRLLGRVLAVDDGSARLTLGDDSGRVTLAVAGPLPGPGDIVAASVTQDPQAGAAVKILTPYRRDVPFPSPGAEWYRLQREESGSTRLARLRTRARVLARIRAFFAARDFVEVQTPQRVRHPGLEPQLTAEAAGEGYLITSPEYQMKRLLAGGLEQIYFLGSCWRGDEQGPHHLNEFCLLEWYRAHAGLQELMGETEQLVCELAEATCGQARLTVRGRDIALDRPFVRLSVCEAFERFAGVDISGTTCADELRERLERAGAGPVDPEAGYDELFSRLLVDRVEPQLARLGAVFLHHFPAPLAALARRDPADPTLAERVELYLGGVELSNGFAELTDPDEQLARLQADQQLRRDRGLPAHEIDARFIEALREGIPPSAGNALGVDRLLMLLTGAQNVADVVCFAADEL